MRLLLRCIAALLLSGVAGCAAWDPPESQPPLPSPRISPDSVVLEIETVRFGEHRQDEFHSLWRAVDEQYLSVEFRQQLRDNGLRCGLLDAQIPHSLREAIRDRRPALDQLQDGEFPEIESTTGYRQLACRAGRKYRIVVTEQEQNRIVPFSEENRIWAATFPQAQGFFSLVTSPLGDSRVKVGITPVIEHGEVRQRYKPGPANYIMDAARDENELEFLRSETVLAPGVTLVLGSSPEPKGLGRWYFGGDESSRSVLLIRLLQTQYDELFSPELSTDTLATPLE